MGVRRLPAATGGRGLLASQSLHQMEVEGDVDGHGKRRRRSLRGHSVRADGSGGIGGIGIVSEAVSASLEDVVRLAAVERWCSSEGTVRGRVPPSDLRTS